jgi:hypothetical protein
MWIRRALLLATLGVALLAPAPARSQGKTYTIKGMGKHYTKIGKQIRRQEPQRRHALVQLRGGPGFVTANPERAFGTRLAVDTVRSVMAAFEQEYPRQPIIVRDLSKRNGGVLGNHNSHVDGRDVDIQLPLNPVEDVTDRSPRTVAAGQTWFLIRALVDSCAIEYIFVDKEVQRAVHRWAVLDGVPAKELEMILQYPRPERRAVGVVRHWTNHQDHLHVRFLKAAALVDGAEKTYCEWKKAARSNE